MILRGRSRACPRFALTITPAQGPKSLTVAKDHHSLDEAIALISTLACVMFTNGCGIRSLNELLLHRSLNQTAQYTPIPLEDLRRVLIACHPRA